MSDELGRKLKQISDADCDKGTITWAPDSKSLLWAGSDHTLRHVDIESGETEEIASSNVAPIGSPQFSPDGMWISYSKEDALLRSRVYIKKTDGGPEHAIDSDQFVTASGAKWTPDGKKLVFIAGIGAPAMSSLNRTTYQLYSLALTHITTPQRQGYRYRAAGRSRAPPATAAARAGPRTRKARHRRNW